MPDSLNHEVGPQPLGAGGGGPYVPGVPNNKDGPQAWEPSKCLNRLSYGQRLAKEVF